MEHIDDYQHLGTVLDINWGWKQPVYKELRLSSINITSILQKRK